MENLLCNSYNTERALPIYGVAFALLCSLYILNLPHLLSLPKTTSLCSLIFGNKNAIVNWHESNIGRERCEFLFKSTIISQKYMSTSFSLNWRRPLYWNCIQVWSRWFRNSFWLWHYNKWNLQQRFHRISFSQHFWNALAIFSNRNKVDKTSQMHHD